jgi:omega-amidase
MKIALCQMKVTRDKADNIGRARDMLLLAGQKGADIAILPEMFCILYDPKLFDSAAEPCPGGECFDMLSLAAESAGMTVIGGSVPERDGGRIYNTCMCFGPDGKYLGKYRKAHLFDVDLPGYRFYESETVSPGNERPLMLEQPLRTGVAICFDVRFPEWMRFMFEAGADLIALPAAFSARTGPRHWELLLRARALDNQCFVAGVSPSKNSYGHSMIVSPDGMVVVSAGDDPALIVQEIDMDEISRLRGSIPIKKCRRRDLY